MLIVGLVVVVDMVVGYAASKIADPLPRRGGGECVGMAYIEANRRRKPFSLGRFREGQGCRRVRFVGVLKYREDTHLSKALQVGFPEFQGFLHPALGAIGTAKVRRTAQVHNQVLREYRFAEFHRIDNAAFHDFGDHMVVGPPGQVQEGAVKMESPVPVA